MLTEPVDRSSLGIGHAAFAVIGSHILHPGSGDKITPYSLTAQAVGNKMGSVHPVSFISPAVIQTDLDDLVLFRPAARILGLRDRFPPAGRILYQFIIDVPDYPPGSPQGVKFGILDLSLFGLIAYLRLACLYHVIRS